MTPEMKETMEKVFALQVIALETESVFSHGLLRKPDGSHNVYSFDPDFMSEWQKKNQLAAMMLRELFEHKGVFAFSSDAWQTRLPEGKRREDMPKSLGEWPAEYRREIILCCANQIGQRGASAQQVYERKGSKIVLQEIEWDMPFAAGRFIFDLTNTNLDKAIAVALNKNSEGIGGLQ